MANLASRIGRSENPVRLSRVPDWSQLSSQLWCPASAPESVIRHALSASDIVTGCAPYSQPQPRKRKASADRRAPFFSFPGAGILALELEFRNCGARAVNDQWGPTALSICFKFLPQHGACVLRLGLEPWCLQGQGAQAKLLCSCSPMELLWVLAAQAGGAAPHRHCANI